MIRFFNPYIHNHKLVLISAIIAGTVSSICKAQLTNSNFQNFSQTYINPYLINPAATDSSYSFNVIANNINELGLLKNVNRFYLDADKRYSTAEEGEFHFLGVQALNTKLGDYISGSKLQFRYSWLTKVTNKSMLSAGASLGFVNYSFQTTQGGTGGTDYAPDGAVGIHYLRKNTVLGVAVQQIFTPTLIPVNQSFQLKRLYNIDVTQRLDISSFINLAFYSVLQLSDQGKSNYNVGMMTSVGEVGLIGINNFSFTKTTVNLGLKNILLLDLRFKFVASYSFYHSGISLPDNILEVFVSIQK